MRNSTARNLSAQFLRETEIAINKAITLTNAVRSANRKPATPRLTAEDLAWFRKAL